jgi:hypothetical protein
MKLIFKIFCLTIAQLSFAQVPTICLNSAGNPDPNCICRAKNNCYKAFDKSLTHDVNKAEKTMGEGRGKKLYTMVAPDLKAIDSMYDGSKKFEDFDIESMNGRMQKLDKVNNALLVRVEMKMKQNGVKNYRFKDRVALLNKAIENSFPPAVIADIKKHGFTYNPFTELITGKSSFKLPVSQDNEENDDNNIDQDEKTITEESIASSVVTEDTKPGEPSRFSEAELAKMRAKKFAINDINKDKAKDLFSLITYRYQAVSQRVGFMKLNKSKENFKKDQVLKEIFDTIDKM